MLRQLITLCPPHRLEIEAEVLGNLLERCSAVKLTGDGSVRLGILSVRVPSGSERLAVQLPGQVTVI